MLTVSSDNFRWQYCQGSAIAEQGYQKKLNGHEIAKIAVIHLVKNYFESNKQLTIQVGETLVFGGLQIEVTQKIMDRVLLFLQQIDLNFKVHYANFNISGNENYEIYINDGICVASNNSVELFIYNNEYKAVGIMDNPSVWCVLSLYCDQQYKELKCTVIQPNCSTTSVTSFFTEDQIKVNYEKLINLNFGIDKKFTVNPHCKSCSHYQHCEEVKKYNQGEVMQHELIVSKVHSELETMSNEDLASILNCEESFTDAFTRANQEALDRLEAGHVINGFHLGTGRVSFKWNEDADTVEKKLKGMKVKKDGIFPSQLITPAQARKLENLTDAQRSRLEGLIAEVVGKNTIKKNDFGVQPEVAQISFL